MTGYDALALRMMRVPLAYRRIGLASFIGYAFSNNIGLSMIAGASVVEGDAPICALSAAQSKAWVRLSALEDCSHATPSVSVLEAVRIFPLLPTCKRPALSSDAPIIKSPFASQAVFVRSEPNL